MQLGSGRAIRLLPKLWFCIGGIRADHGQCARFRLRRVWGG